MKRIICLLLAVLVLAGALTACSGGEGDDWKNIKKRKTLLIGVTEYPPFTYSENDTYTGFDAELAQTVCEKLGITAEFVPIEWTEKELALDEKRIDVIWSGLTITPARRGNMDFSAPYLNNRQCIVVKKDHASDYSGVSSFDGKKVVAANGSAGEAAARYILIDAVFEAVSTPANALRLVKKGEADAAVVDYSMAEILTAEDKDYSDLKILSYISLMDEEFAVGFRKGSTALPEIDKILEELLSDGTVAALAEKYGLSRICIQ